MKQVDRYTGILGDFLLISSSNSAFSLFGGLVVFSVPAQLCYPDDKFGDQSNTRQEAIPNLANSYSRSYLVLVADIIRKKDSNVVSGKLLDNIFKNYFALFFDLDFFFGSCCGEVPDDLATAAPEEKI